jgi:hypothetical protein
VKYTADTVGAESDCHIVGVGSAGCTVAADRRAPAGIEFDKMALNEMSAQDTGEAKCIPTF